jgi:outer membrane protein assembly factor BamD
MINSFRFTVLLLLSLISACSFFGGSDTSSVSNAESAEQLYLKARTELQKKNYTSAIELYETLEARYPFGPHAQQAQLETAYAYYKFEEADSAIANADRFIRLNPNHQHVDYAYYIKALANFNRSPGLLSSLIPRDRADKDPEPLRRSFDDFKTLVSNYPNSRYTEDSRKRMVYLRNVLAEHEMKVADYYMRRGAYVGALNRTKYVIEYLQGSESVPRALNMMVLAYRKLGLNDLAQDTLKVLELNYPTQITEEIRKNT